MPVAKRRLSRLGSRFSLIVVGILVLAAPSFAAESESVYALDRGGQLLKFSTATPGTVTTIGTIGPLAVGESVVGIDEQPSSGRLFAVTSASRVFTLDKSTAAATQVGTTAFTPVVAAAATSFGVDFNPVPNAIRFLSSGAGANQSLRISPVTGAVAGTDTAPASSTVVADAAYSNSVNGANSTTLYAIDSTSGELKRIGGLGGSPSPNAGAVTTVGSLGVSSSGDVGFDISGATNTAYASLQSTAGAASFHFVNLSTGEASPGVPIGAVATDVVDIAVDAQPPSVQFAAASTAVREDAGTASVTITRTGNTDAGSTVSFATTAAGGATAGGDFTAVAATPVTFAAGETSKTVTVPVLNDRLSEPSETIGVAITAPTGASLGAPNAALITVIDDDAPYAASDSETVYALSGAGTLLSFSTTTPGTVASIGAITGLGLTEKVLGIDVQPSTGRLFAVTDASKVYTLNKATAAATQIGTTAFTPPVTGTSHGVDFNPVPNAIRFLASDAGTNQSLRISPVSGAVAGTDTAPAGSTVIADAAYSNAINGANSTTLYVIDSGSAELKRIGGQGGSPSPNGGGVTVVGPLGTTTTSDVGFDISGATNTAYVSLQATAGAATFHKIDLSSGQVSTGTPIGAVPTNVIDIAVEAPTPSVQFSAAASAVSEGAGSATVTLTRTGNTDGVSNVTVSTTASGTATAGSDFTAISAQAVQFAAGESSKTVVIPVSDDTTVESPETITVSAALAAASPGASLGAPNATTVTVFDNDPTTVAGPTVTVDKPFLVTGNQVFLTAAPNRVNRSSLVSKGLSFNASCSETCVLNYTLRIGSTVLGTATAQRTGAGLVAVKLTLTDAGKSAINTALQSKRPASKLIRLDGTATDSDGGTPARGGSSLRVYRT